jgi:hypothetical protein
MMDIPSMFEHIAGKAAITRDMATDPRRVHIQQARPPTLPSTCGRSHSSPYPFLPWCRDFFLQRSPPILPSLSFFQTGFGRFLARGVFDLPPALF